MGLQWSEVQILSPRPIRIFAPALSGCFIGGRADFRPSRRSLNCEFPLDIRFHLTLSPRPIHIFAPAVSGCIVDGRADSRPFRRTAFVLLEQTVLPLSLGPTYLNELQPPVGGVRFYRPINSACPATSFTMVSRWDDLVASGLYSTTTR